MSYVFLSSPNRVKNGLIINSVLIFFPTKLSLPIVNTDNIYINI